jgi:hypothetical protein
VFLVLFLLYSVISSQHSTLDSLFTVKMRYSPISLALVSASLVSAQQYAGDVIPGTLPPVANSEIAFWKIADPNGGDANLTLINYASLNTQGQRPDQSKIQRAVIPIHGLLRDPWGYQNDVCVQEPMYAPRSRC